MPRSRAPPPRSTGSRRATPTAACRSCACRSGAMIWRRSAKRRARLTAHASDIVILGTGGSSLGGQTLAQLAGHGVPGLGLLRGEPRLHFMDNLDPETYGALLAKLPLAATRFVAISKSGGTAETLMQTIAALSAVKEAGLDRPHPGAVSRPHRAGQGGQGQRPARAARRARDRDARPRSGRRRTLLGAHQCGAAAGRHARPRHRGGARRRRRRARARARASGARRGAGGGRRRACGRARRDPRQDRFR